MGTCYNSTVVNAPIEKVWEAVRNFHDLSWAKGLDLQIKATNDLKADQIGATRAINDTFFETLIALNDREHTFSYTIDNGPGPVAKDVIRNYVGKVELLSITDENKTYVLWSSRYDSPNDAAVGELCNPIYQGALKGLKEYFA